MSLLNDLAGSVLGALSGSNQGNHGGLLEVALDLVKNTEGGLPGLIDKFQQAGLADQIRSWVGTGANLPVNAEQIAAVLGQGTIGELVGKLGLSPDQVSGGLAQLLPVFIDKLTPNGSTDGVNDLLSQGLSALTGLLGGNPPPQA